MISLLPNPTTHRQFQCRDSEPATRQSAVKQTLGHDVNAIDTEEPIMPKAGLASSMPATSYRERVTQFAVGVITLGMTTAQKDTLVDDEDMVIDGSGQGIMPEIVNNATTLVSGVVNYTTTMLNNYVNATDKPEMAEGGGMTNGETATLVIGLLAGAVLVGGAARLFYNKLSMLERAGAEDHRGSYQVPSGGDIEMQDMSKGSPVTTATND